MYKKNKPETKTETKISCETKITLIISNISVDVVVDRYVARGISINQSFLIQATRPIRNTHNTNDLQTTNIRRKKKKKLLELLTTYTIHN